MKDFSLTICGTAELDPSTGYVNLQIKGIPQAQKDAILAWLRDVIPSCEGEGSPAPTRANAPLPPRK